MKKNNNEGQFAVYNERKAKIKASFFRASLEGFIRAGAAPISMWALTGLFFIYSKKMGIWCWIVFFSFFAIVISITYSVTKYRELLGIRNLYSEEEFEEIFREELPFFKVMEKLSKFLAV